MHYDWVVQVWIVSISCVKHFLFLMKKIKLYIV